MSKKPVDKKKKRC